MGLNLWWQNGPISGIPQTLAGDPGANVDANGNGTGWGDWQHH
jgi:hypothetical protein